MDYKKAYKKNGYSLRIFFSGTKDNLNCSYRLKRIVRDAIEKTLFTERFWRDTELSVTFCNNEYIHKLNKQYRDKDAPTDVLSFPLYDDGDITEFDCQAVTLGDIVISLERAKEQAKEIGHSFEEEVAFLTIHSTLHLLGYDHERSPEDDEDMCERQRQIVKTVKFDF